jgi:two-component system, response regulator PdtaR
MATARLPAKLVVLVVEDEPLMRMHAVGLVEEAGFDAVEAGNADKAIAILESRRDIRIVFTDIDMPGSMDGIRLAHAIRGRWPPIELILTSGHFHIRDEDIPKGGLFFPKPYAADKIIDALQTFAT